jgi:thiamine biosynthesis lipoprotein
MDMLFTGEAVPAVKKFYALGTVNELKVFGNCDERVFEEAEDRLNEIDDRMPVFKAYKGGQKAFGRPIHKNK